MTLSSYWMNKICIAETMNYGLDSDDLEELIYHNKIINVMDDMKKPVKREYSLIKYLRVK